ncbi:MAG: hypothetical protein KBS67_00215 [Bacteroidales bacterium]|nr:hypothetical protein [Candidatus Cryptobacteroides equifaecalis]
MALLLIIPGGCGTAAVKMKNIKREKLQANIQLPADRQADFKEITPTKGSNDTIRVTGSNGEEMILMKAIKDDDGEMVANEVLDAAVVTARFRNVAERHGKIDLEFDVIVPESMQDREWQLTFFPDMFILEDSIRLDPVIITGALYRKSQMRGYQQYERFLSSIITDPELFLRKHDIEVFLQRNYPSLYALKSDSTFVSDEMVAGVFGVSEREVLDHYTRKLMKKIHGHRENLKGKMYARYVKSPIATTGIRLDTVIRDVNGDFRYRYVQEVMTRAKLKKIDIVLSGKIDAYGELLYHVPAGDPLTFYVSSLSAFVDGTEHYKTMVVERKAAANSACYIEFEGGKADIREDMGHNLEEMGRIKGNLRQLLTSEVFDLDSITVTSFASPEGALSLNERLCLSRSRSASDYFSRFVRGLRDSIKAERGLFISFDEKTGTETLVRTQGTESGDGISFLSSSGGENWRMLDRLVEIDEQLQPEEKEEFRRLCEDVPDVDERESILKKTSYYRHLRQDLYPQLRVVKFDFFLHRRGMIKDTVHTTVLDTIYMDAVQMLRDRDYEEALKILRPYNDYNTAIAYVALDRNTSAMNILKDLPRTGQVNYMLAILYSREGDDQKAVQCYFDACRQDPGYVHRGNLDPEISALIKKYDLNREPEDEYGDLGM